MSGSALSRPALSRPVAGAVVALELGTGALGLAALLACDVGVAERACTPGTLAPAVALLGPLAGALVLALVLAMRERSATGSLARAASALLPLLALAPTAARGCLASDALPSFAEVVLAPFVVGAAVARLHAALAGRSRRARPTLPRALVVLAALVVGVLFAGHALALLDGLAIGHHDAGDYAVRLENSLRGRPLACDPGHGAFWDHLNPGLGALVPFYALARPWFPGARFTTLAQAVLLAGTVPLAFGLARRRLGDPVAAAFAALALLVAPLFTQLNVAYSYGFHTVSLALPLLVGAAWAYAAGRRGLALALVVGSWLCEETIAPGTFGMGVALALGRRTRRDGLLLAAGSLGYFFLATKVLLPWASGGTYYCASFFAHLGNGLGEIALAPVTKPVVFWGTLLDRASLALVATLLLPWLLLPAARPRWLLAAAPVLAFACLREDPHLKAITHWHHTNVLAWLFLALADGIAAPAAARVLGVRRRGRARRRALALGALASALVGALLLGDAPLGRTHRPFVARPGLGAVAAELQRAVPAGASLISTERAAAHLVADHPEVHVLRPEYDPARPGLEGIDWFLLDLEDDWGLARLPRVRRFAHDLRGTGATAVWRRPFVLLARRGLAPEAPRPDDRAQAPGGPARLVFFEAGLSLLEWRRVSPERARLVWRVDRATDADWGLAIFDASGGEASRGEGAGLAGEVGAIGAVPTYERRAGEVFVEERGLAFPDERRLELRAFDFLELEARGLSVADVVGGRLGVPGR